MSTLMGPGGIGVPMFGGGMTKTEDGKAYRKGDYAYTPDDVPSHWKLRLTNTPGGKPDPHIVGAAVAALGAGFRGNKVRIPAADLPMVKRRVLRAWHATHGKDEEVPAVLKASTDDVEGTAPPGWKHSVERMKKDHGIDNPFALAWWMRNRGAKPSRHEADMSASADDTSLLKSLVRQQRFLPPICVAAARGEAWAQAQLLSESYPPLMVEGKW